MPGAFIRFLHAADLRLDLPVDGLDEAPPHLRDLLVDAPYDAARRVFDVALKERVDFVVLAGNVVDPLRCGPRGIAFLLEQFHRLAEQEIVVYWAGGRHDSPALWPDAAKLPSNVQVFAAGKLEELSHFRGDSVIATLVGFSHDDQRSVRPGDFNPDSSGQFTIGIVSGEFDAGQLAPEGLHYWALGGRANRDTLFASPHCAHYAGSPQGREARDAGPHGCTLVHVDPEQHVRLQFVPTDSLRWNEEIVSFTGEVARHVLNDMLREGMKKIVAEAGDRPTLVSLRLEGLARSRGMRYEHLETELAAQLRHEFGYGTPPVWVAGVDIKPPSQLPEPWYEEDTLLGDYLRLMRDVQKDEAHDLALASLLSGPNAEEAADLVRWQDAGHRQRVLEDAALLGVDLLRSGEMSLDGGSLAGYGSLTKETSR
jgi:DNA repair exonuclease SbcCD nuclease subunit